MTFTHLTSIQHSNFARLNAKVTKLQNNNPVVQRLERNYRRVSIVRETARNCNGEGVSRAQDDPEISPRTPDAHLPTKATSPLLLG